MLSIQLTTYNYLNIKKMKNIYFLLFAIFSLNSCTEVDSEIPKENAQASNVEETDQSTLWSIIKGSENHNYLEAAVVAAELQGVLSDSSVAFTVLAPSDEAFTDLAEELGVSVPDLLELPNLTDILLYHVLPEVILEEVLLQSQVNSMYNTLLNEPIYFQSLATSVTVNGVASVTLADLAADNGVVNVIDKVVLR
jgi:transforming growth factor-beta-induced protein